MLFALRTNTLKKRSETNPVFVAVTERELLLQECLNNSDVATRVWGDCHLQERLTTSDWELIAKQHSRPAFSQKEDPKRKEAKKLLANMVNIGELWNVSRPDRPLALPTKEVPKEARKKLSVLVQEHRSPTALLLACLGKPETRDLVWQHARHWFSYADWFLMASSGMTQSQYEKRYDCNFIVRENGERSLISKPRSLKDEVGVLSLCNEPEMFRFWMLLAKKHASICLGGLVEPEKIAQLTGEDIHELQAAYVDEFEYQEEYEILKIILANKTLKERLHHYYQLQTATTVTLIKGSPIAQPDDGTIELALGQKYLADTKANARAEICLEQALAKGQIAALELLIGITDVTKRPKQLQKYAELAKQNAMPELVKKCEQILENAINIHIPKAKRGEVPLASIFYVDLATKLGRLDLVKICYQSDLARDVLTPLGAYRLYQLACVEDQDAAHKLCHQYLTLKPINELIDLVIERCQELKADRPEADREQANRELATAILTDPALQVIYKMASTPTTPDDVAKRASYYLELMRFHVHLAMPLPDEAFKLYQEWNRLNKTAANDNWFQVTTLLYLQQYATLRPKGITEADIKADAKSESRGECVVSPKLVAALSTLQHDHIGSSTYASSVASASQLMAECIWVNCKPVIIDVTNGSIRIQKTPKLEAFIKNPAILAGVELLCRSGGLPWREEPTTRVSPPPFSQGETTAKLGFTAAAAAALAPAAPSAGAKTTASRMPPPPGQR